MQVLDNNTIWMSYSRTLTGYVLDTIQVAQLYVKYMRDWRAEGETMPEGITTYN